MIDLIPYPTPDSDQMNFKFQCGNEYVTVFGSKEYSLQYSPHPSYIKIPPEQASVLANFLNAHIGKDINNAA